MTDVIPLQVPDILLNRSSNNKSNNGGLCCVNNIFKIFPEKNKGDESRATLLDRFSLINLYFQLFRYSNRIRRLCGAASSITSILIFEFFFWVVYIYIMFLIYFRYKIYSYLN